MSKAATEVFCEKMDSKKFRKLHRKISVLDSLFNEVAGLTVSNFIKKRLQARWCPVKFVKFLRTSILKNICERLLLKCICTHYMSPPLYHRSRATCLLPQSQSIWRRTYSFRTGTGFMRNKLKNNLCDHA